LTPTGGAQGGSMEGTSP